MIFSNKNLHLFTHISPIESTSTPSFFFPVLPFFLFSFLPYVSVSFSPAGIIYHHIQQSETPLLLCLRNACSHAAIKAKRDPLPPAPMGALQRRGKDTAEGKRVSEGIQTGDREGNKEDKCFRLMELKESERNRGGGSKRETGNKCSFSS